MKRPPVGKTTAASYRRIDSRDLGIGYHSKRIQRVSKGWKVILSEALIDNLHKDLQIHGI